MKLSTITLKPLGACLSATLAVLGAAAFSGSPARASLPVATISSSLPGQAGEYGTIKGRLVWGGAEAPAPKVDVATGQAQKDPAVCASTAAILSQNLVVNPKDKGVKWGIAYLVKPKGANDEAVKALVGKSPKVTIDQKNCEFIPYAVAINQGQTIEFKSSDPVNHNVHLSPFTNEGFNPVLPPNGKIDKKLIAEKRAIPLTCDIHPWMKGWIMVFDHPFFAVTKEDGSFEITGVPAGTQNLVIWQSAVGYATPKAAVGMPVEVKAGATTDVGEIKLDPTKVKP